MPTDPLSVDAAHRELIALADILGTLVAWMAQSANSPISVTEAKTLIARLEKLRHD